MFHKEFYPTPSDLANELAGPYKGKVKSILDPSAGKGDLLSPFNAKLRWGGVGYRLYAIEQSLELCSILREKDITVLGTDFFDYGGEHFFDLVIMNPPFSNCTDHFLYAWNVCQAREIVSILPAWAIDDSRNVKTETIARIVRDNGVHEELGSRFSVAERPTGADVVKVTVKKEDSGLKIFSFNPENDVDEVVDPEQIVGGGLVKRDVISTVVRQYGESVSAVKDMLSAVSRVRKAIGMLIPPISLDGMIGKCVKSDNIPGSYNELVDALKVGCWNALLREGEFSKYMTTSARKDFQKFIEDNRGLAFSEVNIASVMEALVMSNDDIFKQNIVDVFDILTKYHKGNRVHPEGWKTNDQWKVKRKFILPYIVNYDSWGMSQAYHYMSELDDIDTAMCTITGKRVEDIESIRKAIDRGCKDGWPVESTFFCIKCYQKGTGHFEFRDEDLWDKFNRIACDGKRWLPEGQ